MTSIFHNEVTGGERFFEILEQMQKDLGHHEPVVELMYLCMSLGFIGRYRVMPRGVAALTELRDGVYHTIRQRRGEFERELSPQWRGIAAGARSLSRRIPLWALGLGTVAIAAAMFVTFHLPACRRFRCRFRRTVRAAAAWADHHTASDNCRPSLLRPPASSGVAPVASRAFAKLRQFLEPEIRAGLVQVFQDAQASDRKADQSQHVRFRRSHAGRARTIQLIGRIGDALNGEAGDVRVFGFTDDQPIRTARFPSNFELSQARADAVAALLRRALTDPKRLSAQGQGAADPIASNATPDGRQQNRRTEIVLVRASDAM